MSVDVQLAWPCTHVSLEETVGIGADRVTLTPRQSIANSTTVRVYANDVTIPQSGLFSPAILYSSRSGPYQVSSNERVLTVASSAGSVSVTVTEKSIDARVFVAKYSSSLTNVSVSEENNRLVFVDTNKHGDESFVRISGSAAVWFGFGDPMRSSAQWLARGSSVFPSWSLVGTSSVTNNKVVKFSSPVRQNPIFRVTYSMYGRRCLRCGGTSVENDCRFDDTGQVILVQDDNLLYQAALKIILTVRGSNPYHPWYGSTISNLIGSKAVGDVSSMVSESIRNSLTKLQSMQVQQAKFQEVSYKERLYSILSIKSSYDKADPTAMNVEVTVQNSSREQINLSVVFTVPGVTALAGTNGLSLG